MCQPSFHHPFSVKDNVNKTRENIDSSLRSMEKRLTLNLELINSMGLNFDSSEDEQQKQQHLTNITNLNIISSPIP